MLNLLSSILLGIVFLSPALAEAPNYRPASEVKVSTPKYVPEKSEYNFQYGTYEYDVSWEGIPAATASISMTPDGNKFKMKAEARTAKGIDIFYKLRYQAEGLLGESFEPVHTLINHKENSKERITEISFDDKTGVIHSSRTRKGKGTEVETFNPENDTLDPFSSAMLARSLSWKVGQSRSFDTYNGKTRYLITLTCEDEKEMVINGEKRLVSIVVPDVKNLNDETKNKKLRRAEIYVTADSARELLQIKSQVFIGNVYVRLKSFTPYQQPQVQIASSQKTEWVF